jgi:hypothetical protein
MTPSPIILDSLLCLDIGEITTRALLFDVVDGAYRFIAAGSSPTTAGLPWRSVLAGAQMAIENLTEITGRQFIGGDGHLILPTSADGSGVDALTLVMSAGAPLRVVVVGLLEDVSVESAQRLAATTYTKVVDIFSLNDRRKAEARMDTLIRLRPDAVLIAGGNDSGADVSMLKLMEPVRLACNLLPGGYRPQVLYAGNASLEDKVKSAFSPLTTVEIAPNIRPTLETERLDSAHLLLARIFRQVRIRQMSGLQELDTWAGGGLLPRATAFGRVIRFLSQDDPSKGVLGVDVGASATALAVALGGKLSQGVYPELGLSRCIPTLIQREHVGRVMGWLSVDIPESVVRDYLYNKTLFPGSLPTSAEDLAIEQALARYVMRAALHRARGAMRFIGNGAISEGFLPPVEPIIACGNVLTQAPSQGQAMLMLLDALQPSGITTLVLDRNNLAAALGASAGVNPTLTVQVMDSGAFPSLGTVISPVSSARLGAPILRVQVTYKDSAEEVKIDVKQGSLEVIPLAPGQVAALHLKPLHRADIGMGPGRGGSLKRVVGSGLGIVIDARGRPIQLSEDPDRRRELFKKWLWTLGS